ncbi:hypothetical protein K1719_011643 [Acacia pycnantha]|nr:hypothetical protein K1719_011643 [Acacia pycnantha]
MVHTSSSFLTTKIALHSVEPSTRQEHSLFIVPLLWLLVFPTFMLFFILCIVRVGANRPLSVSKNAIT